MPSIDLLNEKRVLSSQIGRVFSSLPQWNRGENHLIFNFLPGLAPDKESFPDVQLGRAMVAGECLGGYEGKKNRNQRYKDDMGGNTTPTPYMYTSEGKVFLLCTNKS